ncbi:MULTISPECIES: hypothetical protein [Streptomyces]|uniref:Uncharacterized protein n=1 Tax=Streptomyces amritsarensis TaxID=681158 RepID=A0ABX3G577_9ACTN|nr:MULTISPECIES: hypothetical protein [Streptomyces]AQT70714.1 hypothetical protein B1K54_02305 [Streptomyces sp. fd1-xmd]MDX6762851.1 hypothetical protein [Streptomyces sp. F8]OLZ69596.1 hypothetical protein AVW11_09930 [Streptomyces amritsarensis]
MSGKSHKGTSQHKASRHGGAEHGWSPDIDEERQQDNPSAHRSFHPDRYAPAPGAGRTVSKEESGNPHGRPTESSSRGGEEVARKGEDGMRDKGPRGKSQRPSGSKDASAFTGVRPEDHRTEGPAGR